MKTREIEKNEGVAGEILADIAAVYGQENMENEGIPQLFEV